jgi:tRNA modification GTPase
LAKSDIVLYIIDAGKKNAEKDIEFIKQSEHDGKYCIIVVNKTDITPPDSIGWLERFNREVYCVSALRKQGIDKVKDAICRFISSHVNTQKQTGYTVNQRHYLSLTDGLEALNNAKDDFKQGVSEEFFVEHLKDASRALAEIIGEVSSDTILDRIFSDFCIGK